MALRDLYSSVLLATASIVLVCGLPHGPPSIQSPSGMSCDGASNQHDGSASSHTPYPTKDDTLSGSSLPTSNLTAKHVCNGWTYIGCAIEPAGALALSDASYTSDKLTIGICQAYCAELTLHFAGLESGSQCYCGRKLSHRLSGWSRNCSVTPCAGNASEWCGGPSLVSVWNDTRRELQKSAVWSTRYQALRAGEYVP